jgi:uncharacterized membrane protein YgcG
MDQYKISQNPGSGPKKSVKHKAKSKIKAPKRRDTKSISPQLVMTAVVVVLIMILGGISWAHFFANKVDNTGDKAKQASAKAGNKPGSGGVIPGPAFTNVTGAIGNKDVAVLRQYYAKKVHIVVVKKGVNQTVGAGQVEGIVSNPLNGAVTPWDWHVPAGTISSWQTGPYGQYFTGNVIIGLSSDGTVVSIHFDGNGQIDGIFVAPVGDLTTPSGGGGTGGSGSGGSSGGGSTPVSNPGSGTTVIGPNGAD